MPFSIDGNMPTYFKPNYFADGTTTFHVGDTPPTPHRSAGEAPHMQRGMPQRPNGSVVIQIDNLPSLAILTKPSVTYRPDSVVIHIPDRADFSHARSVSSSGATTSGSHVSIEIPEEETIAAHFQALIPESLGEDIREGLMAHFREVANRLVEKRETLEDVTSLSKKALRRDLVAAAAGGVVNHLPTMVAGLTADFVPHFFAAAERLDNPVNQAAALGATAAAFEHSADTFGCYALSLRLVPSDAGDRYYLAPKVEKLVGPAARAQQAMALSTSREALNDFIVSQASMARVGLVIPVATAVDVAQHSPEITAIAENTLNNVLRLPTGAAKDALRYGIEHWAGRYGPLWLFGRQDWEHVYDNLKDSPAHEPVNNALRNLLVLPYDAVRHLGNNLKNFASPGKLALGASLVGGISAYAAARAGIKEGVERLGTSRDAGDAIAKTVALPLRGFVVGAAEAMEKPAEKTFHALYRAIDRQLLARFDRDLAEVRVRPRAASE